MTELVKVRLHGLGKEESMQSLRRCAFALMAIVGSASMGYSATLSCPASFTTDGTAKVFYGIGQLTAAGACEYVAPPDNNAVANEESVNAALFFGTNTWAVTTVSQFDPPSDQSGTWSIAAVDFATYDYMITFKDGEGTNLISFLFNEEASSGGWISPFDDPPFDEANGDLPKDVSHFSIFRRAGSIDPPDPVPEPAALLLMGFGLLGAGYARRRR